MTPQSVHVDAIGIRIEWELQAGSATFGDNASAAPAGRTATFGAAALRRACRCAECQRVVRLGQALSIPDDLRLVDASSVGSYGVQLHFSDGHARGIYPWAYLAELHISIVEMRASEAQRDSVA